MAVCQEQNIARAAEREFIAPSAVSRRIADIESLTGLSLIERHARGITVTPAGRTVWHHARLIIGAIETMGAALSGFYEGIKGRVRLVANASAIVQFLPEDIVDFQRLFPDVDIDIDEQHSQEAIRMVRERVADFAICGRIPDLDQLEWLPYRRDCLAVMLPANHPLAARKTLTLSEIVQEPLITLRDNSALTQQLTLEAAALNTALTVKFQLGSLDGVCRMTHAGLGIAIMPQQIAEMYAASLRVAVIPLADTWAERELCVVFNDRNQLTATVNTLINFLTHQR